MPHEGSADAGSATDDQASYGYASHGESRWPAALAVMVALVLQAALPGRLTLGPWWAVPGLEALLLIPLMIANPSRLTRSSKDMRLLSIALIAFINLANVVSLALLIRLLVNGNKANGKQLILAAVGVWLTQVIVFGLWYWEVDRGGPVERTEHNHPRPDFLFPQMANPAVSHRHWVPSMVDYLYLSLTNSTAFSPTDTMPLTPLGKVLMGGQSLVSLATIAIVGARAVNILS